MNKQQEVETKIERVVRMLERENLGAVLINTQHNFAWLTAGGTNAVDMSTTAGVGTLCVRRNGRVFLLANRIEMNRLLTEQVQGLNFEPIEFAWEDEQGDAALIINEARALIDDKSARIGADWRTDGAVLIEDKLMRERSELTVSELARFRELGKDAGEAIGEVARALVPNMTEQEIAVWAFDALAARGIYAIVTLVAADERIANFRHPLATAKRWNKTAMIVVCARRDGLVASLTRIVCAGKIPDELARRTECTARVAAQLHAATRAGATGGELYEVARTAYAQVGFAGEQLLHHQGGAAGYRPREWVAHTACAEVVRNNQAFAWNPSITGTKVEESCLLVDNKIEFVTHSPAWTMIEAEANGGTYLLPGVLAL